MGGARLELDRFLDGRHDVVGNESGEEVLTEAEEGEERLLVHAGPRFAEKRLEPRNGYAVRVSVSLDRREASLGGGSKAQGGGGDNESAQQRVLAARGVN